MASLNIQYFICCGRFTKHLPNYFCHDVLFFFQSLKLWVVKPVCQHFGHLKNRFFVLASGLWFARPLSCAMRPVVRQSRLSQQWPRSSQVSRKYGLDAITLDGDKVGPTISLFFFQKLSVQVSSRGTLPFGSQPFHSHYIQLVAVEYWVLTIGSWMLFQYRGRAAFKTQVASSAFRKRKSCGRHRTFFFFCFETWNGNMEDTTMAFNPLI